MKSIQSRISRVASMFGVVACLGAGCTLDSGVTSQIEQALSGMDSQQVVALATNMLHWPIVQDLANAVMADTNLVATLTNAWNEVQDQYQTPDEFEDGGGTVPPDAGGVVSGPTEAWLVDTGWGCKATDQEIADNDTAAKAEQDAKDAAQAAISADKAWRAAKLEAAAKNGAKAKDNDVAAAFADLVAALKENQGNKP